MAQNYLYYMVVPHRRNRKRPPAQDGCRLRALRVVSKWGVFQLVRRFSPFSRVLGISSAKLFRFCPFGMYSYVDKVFMRCAVVFYKVISHLLSMRGNRKCFYYCVPYF